ncbi:MAG: capsular polysaccharide biosynthesis protein [Moraxella sp.]|nr:capsular polysaccharide biosynthesis protein [Moraxella sp.]
MMAVPKSLAVATKGILNNNRLLGVALQADIALYSAKNAPQAVLAWGQKPSRHKALKLADKLALPILTAEDGFLRSLDSGTASRYGASFVLDDLGIYFDLTCPNRLQRLIAQTVGEWNDNKAAQAAQAIDKIVGYRLSKYNASIDAPKLSQLSASRLHVLVIDQVANDASIAGAGVGDDAFYAMLACAIKDNPAATVWIKAHPAGMGVLTYQGALSAPATAHLSKQGIDGGAVRILSDNVNPIALLAQVSDVYSVSSHMGFEALMLGKTVHCFGVSWYVGFGLTVDTAVADTPLYTQVKAHHRVLAVDTASLHQLFYAAYIAYSHYANPATLQACGIDEVMNYLILNRQWQQRWAGDVLAYEFSRWKVPFVRGFLGLPKVHLQFKAKTKTRLLFSDKYNHQRAQKDNRRALMPLINKPDQQYLVWGLSAKRRLAQTISHLQDVPHVPKILCMEDGFIRSNGLGASLLAPLSVVVDDVGIYFDATAPSRLEQILTDLLLDDAQRAQAKQLRALLLNKRVSKYNVGATDTNFLQQLTQLKTARPNSKIRLVVGQVEDDASVQNCASQICTNAELLSRVRADFATDIVIYKPHPDVEAGLRVGKVDECTLQQADLVARHVAMPDCLDVCQVVHTISSLTGFEALVRGLDVVCYGVPFYAGFGLTDDVIETQNTLKIQALNRRARRNLPPLTLNELIFGTLIAYPIYHLPHGAGLATAENVIDYLYNYQEDSEPYAKFAQQLSQMIKTYVMRLRNVTSSKNHHNQI